MRRVAQEAAWAPTAVVGALTVSGLIATSRITGPVFAYLVRWWWVIACLWWLSTLWSAGVALARWVRLRPVRPVACSDAFGSRGDLRCR